jgi:hypothetical protein
LPTFLRSLDTLISIYKYLVMHEKVQITAYGTGVALDSAYMPRRERRIAPS